MAENPARTNRMAPPSPNGFTGLAFDASSLHHVPPPLYNVSPSQPSSVNAAIKLSLTDHKSRHEAAVDMVEGTGLAARCVRQACNPIADHELLLVHTSRYIEYIKALAQTPTGMRVHKMKKTPHEFFMGDLTEYAARKSAGGVVGMCRQVFSGECAGSRVVWIFSVPRKRVVNVLTTIFARSLALGRLHNGFCLVRPSGSMALPDSSSSCCIYNNVALGAATLRQQGASKVMIVDLSRTFPEGIVECFKSEPSILVVSIHCKSECPNSLSSYTGEGPGTGYTCNVSLSPHSCVDDVYLSTLTSLVLPLGRAFRPDALLVSTGFDHSDYLPYGLTLDGYKDSLRLLLKLTKGRCICVTEGGGVKPPSYAAYSAGLLGVLLGEEDKESRVKGGGRSVLSPRTKDRSLGLLGKLSPRKLGSGGSKGKSKDKGKQDIIKSGWMSKQGHFRKSWKNRFFVLTPTKIGYYGHETWDSESPGKGLKGCILLYGAVVDTLADKPALKLLSGKKDKSKCLYIVGRSGEKDFVIDANSRSEVRWSESSEWSEGALRLTPLLVTSLIAG